MTRAYYPWPGTYTTIKSKQSSLNKKILKIIQSDVLDTEHNKKPGMIFLVDNKKLAVACGKNAIILQKIQLQGKQAITSKDLLNGYPYITDAILT